jgi:hypothetical protein
MDICSRYQLERGNYSPAISPRVATTRCPRSIGWVCPIDLHRVWTSCPSSQVFGSIGHAMGRILVTTWTPLPAVIVAVGPWRANASATGNRGGKVSVAADRCVRLQPKRRAGAIWWRALGFVSGTGAVDRERRAAASVRRYRDARQPDLAWLTATTAGGRAAAQAVAGPNTHADALPSRPGPWSMGIHVWRCCPRLQSQHLHAKPWGGTHC